MPFHKLFKIIQRKINILSELFLYGTTVSEASDVSKYFIILSEVAQSHKPGFCEFFFNFFYVSNLGPSRDVDEGGLCVNFKQKGVPPA